jgi:hypothetical protein
VECDIIIRSYYKDFAWLRYALHSIKRYCREFSRVILVTPRASRAKLDYLGLSGDVTVTCPDYRDDYLGQQVTKLTADEMTGAEFICHIDSDCIFQRETTPHDLISSGKPIVLMTPYKELDPHLPWRQLTEKVLARETPYDFMRSPPYTFPNWIYRSLREHVFAMHGVSLEDYILAQPHRGFSEFNALGAYGWHFFRDAFVWREISPSQPVNGPCRVFWSWGGLDVSVEQEISAIIR